LQPDIENWNKNNQTESWLLRDARLNEAQQILDTHEDYLRDKETVYIKASIDLRNREIAEKKAQQQRELRATRRALAGAVIALLIVSLFGGLAWQQRNKALDAAESERAAKNAERVAKIKAQNAAESERMAKNAEKAAKIEAQNAAESERIAKNAEKVTKEQAENQRNELLINQSHILAEKAQQQLSALYDNKPNHPATAINAIKPVPTQGGIKPNLRGDQYPPRSAGAG
jgi:hypothetical protein